MKSEHRLLIIFTLIFICNFLTYYFLFFYLTEINNELSYKSYLAQRNIIIPDFNSNNVTAAPPRINNATLSFQILTPAFISLLLIMIAAVYLYRLTTNYLNKSSLEVTEETINNSHPIS